MKGPLSHILSLSQISDRVSATLPDAALLNFLLFIGFGTGEEHTLQTKGAEPRAAIVSTKSF